MAAVIFDKEPREEEEGFIADRAREGESREDQEWKEGVTEYMCTKEERATEKRGKEGGKGADRGERGLDRGVKSGDLQVQLEQPVTLMVH